MENARYFVLTLLLGYSAGNPVSAWTPDPLCPYPSDEVTFFPSPYNCSEYFECADGNKFVMGCAPNLYWNQNELACDFPQNVVCNITATTDVPIITTVPVTEVPITGVPTASTTVSPAASLCADKQDGSYVANPTDCTKFYECLAGKAIPGQCPLGSVWNEDILNCDHPDNVKCTVNSII